MRKITGVIGAAVALVIVYTGASWYVGKQAQSMIEDGIVKANDRIARTLGVQVPAAQLRIELRSYHRGVFSSEAQYVFHAADAQGEPREYILYDHLQHGLFPVAALRDGKFRPMLAYSQTRMLETPAITEWAQSSADQAPLQGVTEIGFGGKGSSEWTIAPLEMVDEAGNQLRFSGGRLHVDFDENFHDNTADGQFDSWSLTDAATGDTIELHDIAVQSSTKTAADDAFDNHSQLQAKSLSMASKASDKVVTVKDLQLDITVAQRSELANAELVYTFAHIDLDQADLGELIAGIALSNIDVEAVAGLQRKYAEIAGSRGGDISDDFELTADEQAALAKALRPVLGARPELAIRPVSWKNVGGQSEASAFLALRAPDADSDLDPSWDQLVTAAKLDLSVSRPMVVRLFEQVGTGDTANAEQAGALGGQLFDDYAKLLTSTGLMALDNDILSLSLNLKPDSQQVVLNGKAMSTDQLMMLGAALLLLQ